MADFRGTHVRVEPQYRVSTVAFQSYTAREMHRMSCGKILNAETFDSLLHPTAGGLYDPALGPTEQHECCSTCGLTANLCPGHFGHISLPLPVYHPLFFSNMYQLLRSSCWCCRRFLAPRSKVRLLEGQLKLLERGIISQAAELETHVTCGQTETGGVSSAARVAPSEDDTLLSIEKNVRVFLEEEADSTNLGPEVVKTKHTWELKRQFVLQFFRMCGGGKCPNCNAPVRPIRQEYHARIFQRPLSQKMANTWLAVQRQITGNGTGETTTESFAECLKLKYVTPLEAKNHLRMLLENEHSLLTLAFGCLALDTSKNQFANGSPADVFFLDLLPVPPSRFRPVSHMGEKKFENPQTINLHKVLQSALSIQELIREKEKEETRTDPGQQGPSFNERLQSAWVKLQIDINCYVDSDLDRSRGKDAPSGIKQILEKKEGLFRKHMMGKRVNFAARSVISPDVNINMDEIGVPLVFATKLTYPQPVTPWNINDLRTAVINGPRKYPGATHVENEDGSMVLLNKNNVSQRCAIARRLLTPSSASGAWRGTKKVYRHLKSGDVMLLNRQPTLHKPSIMAHKARVLPGERTLRLHYANCKTYNADFDGDEMNAHFPQNELARAEAYNIVATHHQYLGPKDGSPLSGLIQDHIVAGVIMTARGRMFEKTMYDELLHAALPEFPATYQMLPPCIMKPKQLWSGKQVLSTVLLNIIPDDQYDVNLTSTAKVLSKEWVMGMSKEQRRLQKHEEDPLMSEEHIVFRKGEFLCGTLDKSQFGPSQFGLVHSCYELYGGAVANQLLSALGRLFTAFLQVHGFSLGVEDILVTSKANKCRRKVMERVALTGKAAAAEAFGVADLNGAGKHMHCEEGRGNAEELVWERYRSAHSSLDGGSDMKLLDYSVKKRTDAATNEINSICMGLGLHKPFPQNSLQMMVLSGAKGSSVNCMQISCLLGQIELEGQRPPLMPSGRSLPSFLPYDTSPRARGFVDGRFLTGIKPQEYYFHCMAGREGLVDTAVKTSRSGYLQRCLIKHLEGLCVNYDQTVRDSDGSVVQFLYGEDGLDICKTRCLNPKQYPFLVDNYEALVYRLDPASAQEKLDFEGALRHQEKVERWMMKHPCGAVNWHNTRRSAFLEYCGKHLCEYRPPFSSKQNRLLGRSEAQLEVIHRWYELDTSSKKRYTRAARPCPDPTVSCYPSHKHFGSIPERLLAEVNSFTENNRNFSKLATTTKDGVEVTPDKFKSLVQLKCLRSVVEPGEAVGLLAAQSVGEPSTQMTLNTFHFAGRGEMNVTLGIPRLREILMTASRHIKTPTMTVPLLKEEGAYQKGLELKKQLTRVLLSDVLEQVEVWEHEAKVGGVCPSRCRLFRVRLTLLPLHVYEDRFAVTPADVLVYIEKVFFKRLVTVALRTMKTIKEKRLRAVSVEEMREGPGVSGDGENDADRGAPAGDWEREQEDEDGHSDVEGGEEDGMIYSRLRNQQQQGSYDGIEEEDKEILQVNSEDELPMSDEEGERGGDFPTDETREENVAILCGGQDIDRITEVERSNAHILKYSYDAENELWSEAVLQFPVMDSKILMTDIVTKLSLKSVVAETPGIKQCFLVEEDGKASGSNKVWQLKIDGVNLHVLSQQADVLDLSKLYSNNIHAMADTYGIEAACKVIIKEIQDVFQVYGISVDYHHLALIADYVTYEGKYKPFNRIGMESSSSPFQKMSFETTMHFLRSTAIAGDTDLLQSPSARLVTGRVVNGGTGCFELLHPLIRTK